MQESREPRAQHRDPDPDRKVTMSDGPTPAGATPARPVVSERRRPPFAAHSRTRYVAAALCLSVAAAAGATAAPTSGTSAEVSATGASAEAVLTVDAAILDPLTVAATERRADRASRSEERREAPKETPEVVGTRYTTVALKVRTKPDPEAKVVTVVDARAKVRITDQREGEWQQILVDDKARWVAREYLAKRKPPAPEPEISSAACASGSGVENGLNANAVAVHRAVCNRWPQITSYGGVGGGGYHAQGRALDIMVRGSTGDEIATWLRRNAKELGVMEVIWSQRIWTVQRSSEGWRWMSDRGGDTANHYDHVHVSVY